MALPRLQVQTIHSTVTIPNKVQAVAMIIKKLHISLARLGHFLLLLKIPMFGTIIFPKA